MSLGGGNQNGGQTDSRSNFNNSSRPQDQMPNQNSQSMIGQNFASDKEDLNRQFNRPLDRSERSSDGWSRYESQERGGLPGYDNSKYGSRPPPSSSSTSSRPGGEQGRGGHMGGNMGGMNSETFVGRQGGSSELKAMGNGRMGEGGGMVGMGQGYRSSGVPTSMGGSSNGPPTMGGSSNGPPIMGGTSSGGPIISEGRRGAMAASGGLAMERGMVGSFYTSEAQTSQSWVGEQRLGGGSNTTANNSASQTSYPPPGAPMASLASFPPPGIPGNFPPPTSRTGAPPGGFNAGGSSAGFNTGNGSLNRPTGGHGGAGGYDSSKYGRARNKPS